MNKLLNYSKIRSMSWSHHMAQEIKETSEKSLLQSSLEHNKALSLYFPYKLSLCFVYCCASVGVRPDDITQITAIYACLKATDDQKFQAIKWLTQVNTCKLEKYSRQKWLSWHKRAWKIAACLNDQPIIKAWVWKWLHA